MWSLQDYIRKQEIEKQPVLLQTHDNILVEVEEICQQNSTALKYRIYKITNVHIKQESSLILWFKQPVLKMESKKE